MDFKDLYEKTMKEGKEYVGLHVLRSNEGLSIAKARDGDGGCFDCTDGRNLLQLADLLETVGARSHQEQNVFLLDLSTGNGDRSLSYLLELKERILKNKFDPQRPFSQELRRVAPEICTPLGRGGYTITLKDGSQIPDPCDFPPLYDQGGIIPIALKMKYVLNAAQLTYVECAPKPRLQRVVTF